MRCVFFLYYTTRIVVHFSFNLYNSNILEDINKKSFNKKSWIRMWLNPIFIWDYELWATRTFWTLLKTLFNNENQKFIFQPVFSVLITKFEHIFVTFSVFFHFPTKTGFNFKIFMKFIVLSPLIDQNRLVRLLILNGIDP